MTRPGQTLLELVIAIGVVTTSTVAAITLIVRTIAVGQESRAKTEAANYAREGVEVLRMIRDSNWLRIDQNIADGPALAQWDDTGRSVGYERLGGTGTAYYYLNFSPSLGWRAIICPTVAGDVQCNAAGSIHLRNVNLMANGGNSYTSQENSCASPACIPTPYRRIIQVTRCTDTISLAGGPTSLPCLDVVSTVSWVSGGSNKSVRAGTRFYNWR